MCTKYTEEQLTEFNKKLEANLYLTGAAPAKDDAITFQDMKGEKYTPCQEKYPNLWAWYALMVIYEDVVVESWKLQKEEKKPEKKEGKKPEKKVEKKEEKKEEKKADDDDFDPFAEETNEDKEKLAEMQKKKKEEAANKKKEPKKNVARSLILIEVKGWDSEQDLDALAMKIIKEIKLEGLQWKEEYKLAEVAFGVKKIILGMVVEDEICSVDDITEKLESWEDDVQSVDILSFNKL